MQIGAMSHPVRDPTAGYENDHTLEVFSPQREDLLLSWDLLRGWWDAPEQRGGQHGPMEKSSQP
ncbi:MAG TPA: hypothetical protein VKP69_03115 [Isosphaeraceae bacterium]|nr:hypothetical protein [Isosphaeraceae bacterium]